MFALASAWFGLLAFGLSAAMVIHRPLFSDVTLPISLYGAVLAIGCGGLTIMRKAQPGDRGEAVAAQNTQARVGITLGFLAVLITYGLFQFARQEPL